VAAKTPLPSCTMCACTGCYDGTTFLEGTVVGFPTNGSVNSDFCEIQCAKGCAAIEGGAFVSRCHEVPCLASTKEGHCAKEQETRAAEQEHDDEHDGNPTCYWLGPWEDSMECTYPDGTQIGISVGPGGNLEMFFSTTGGTRPYYRLPDGLDDVPSYYWTFDYNFFENEHSVNDGTLTGSTDFEPAHCDVGVDVGSAIPAYVSVSDVAVSFGADFTLSFWMQLPGWAPGAGDLALINQRDNCDIEPAFWDIRIEDDELHWELSDGYSELVLSASSNFSELTHFVVNQGGDTITLYINGVSADSTTNSLSVPEISDTLRIGYDTCDYEDTTIQPLYFIIDELKIFDHQIPADYLYDLAC